MPLFRREPAEVAPEPFVPTPGDRFDGPACFREGFYYPILNDTYGNEVGPMTDMPLVWDSDEKCLKHAHPTDPNHFHRYGMNPVEVQPGEEQS